MASPLRLASRLLGSSLLAQIAVFAAIAVALRTTSPADFAVYGSVSAAAAVLATINTFAAESRLPVVTDDRALALAHAGVTVVAGVLAVGLLLGAVTAALLDGGASGLGAIVLLASTCGAAVGLQQLLTGILLRQQRQQVLATGRVTQGLANAVLILALLPTPLPRGPLLSLAWAASVLVGDLMLLRGTNEAARWCRFGTRKDLRLLASEVRGQPVANLLAGSVGALPNLVLPAVGAWTVAGAWAVVNRFAVPVVNTLYATLQPLYYGRAAELVRRGDDAALGRVHRRWLQRLVLLGLGVAAGAAVGVWWIIPALGPSWEAARDAFWPALWYFPALTVFLPLSQTLVVVGRVDTQLWWTAARAAVCALPWLAVGVIGPSEALLAYAVASAATIGLHLAIQRRALTVR